MRKSRQNHDKLLQERVALAYHLLIVAGHAVSANDTSATIENKAIVCGVESPATFQSGWDILQYMQKVLVMDRWKYLHFYGLEKAPNGWTRFVPTAMFDSELILTEDGQNVEKEAVISGLFPNRFRNMSNALLNVGIMPELPYIVNYTVTEDGELLNATGVTVDLLNLMAERFLFRYRLWVPQDKQYGLLQTNGNWTGLVKDLLLKRTDLIASSLSPTVNRSGVGQFIGLLDDDEMCMLMATSTTTRNAFELLKVFHPVPVMVLAAVSFGASVLAYLFNLISPYSSRNQKHPSLGIYELSFPEHCYMFMKGCLSQNLMAFPRAPCTRLLLISYLFMAFLLFMAWKADVTAFLTRNKVVFAVKSFADLATSSQYNPMVVNGSAVLSFLRDTKTYPGYEILYKRIIANPASLVNSTAVGVQMVLDNPQNVLIGSSTALNFIQKMRCTELVVISSGIDQGQKAMMCRDDAEWASVMKIYLLKLKETGVINRIHTKWSNLLHRCQESTKIYEPLSAKGCSSVFIMFLASLGLSVGALICEIFWFRYGHHVYDHLWARIRLNRPRPKNRQS
ncbi:unnamed protein product [Echinostoma caproni]|uniref:Lig_chan-Glu_bd domain-containing protein n=1 Tax=Echinostoma caproni TaxID=27848 RepID=A0A183AIU9_9TREM|nr:unnamed protein product [Echinostoma caproni]